MAAVFDESGGGGTGVGGDGGGKRPAHGFCETKPYHDYTGDWEWDKERETLLIDGKSAKERGLIVSCLLTAKFMDEEGRVIRPSD